MLEQARTFQVGFCEEKELLEKQFTAAVRDLMELHKAEIETLMHGTNSQRFDLAVKLAQRRRQEAKRRLLAHLDTHHCWKPS